MRRIVFFILLFASISMRSAAQDVATFDDLSLPANSFFADYSAPGTDIGFDEGLLHFPCVYDTSSHIIYVADSIIPNKIDTVVIIDSFWGGGFAYSNVQNTITGDSTNQYAASTGTGYNSAIYAVARGQQNYVNLIGPGTDEPLTSVMITNSTYAYNSMRDGSNNSKKFGGATGTDPDWFKLVIRGYKTDSNNVAHLTDTIAFYLADFRSPVDSDHYILNGWAMVNLAPLGHVDSVTFSLSSSDNGVQGMNTPAYFCIDNFTTNESQASVRNVPSFIAKVYPNPATNTLYVSVNDKTVQQLMVTDLSGKIITTMPVNSAQMAINTSSYVPGVYILQLQGAGKTGTVRFVKQ